MDTAELPWGSRAASLPKAYLWFTSVYSLLCIPSASTLSGEWIGVQWEGGGAGYEVLRAG